MDERDSCAISVDILSESAIDVELQNILAPPQPAVLYIGQILTDKQQAQARKNIGAISLEQIPDPPTVKVDKETIELALGYTPADNDEVAKKLDTYIVTGLYAESSDRYSVLIDDFNWDNMVSAIIAKKYIGCVLWNQDGENPLLFIFGSQYFEDGYIAFFSYLEGGSILELILYRGGNAVIEPLNLATIDYVRLFAENLTPIISETDITAGSPAPSGRPYHVIE